MLTMTLQQLEKRINLSSQRILVLCQKNEMPAPLLYADGTYEWNIVDIANFVEKNIDKYEITPENRRFWNHYIQHRNALYTKGLMSSRRSRSGNGHRSSKAQISRLH